MNTKEAFDLWIEGFLRSACGNRISWRRTGLMDNSAPLDEHVDSRALCGLHNRRQTDTGWTHDESADGG